MVNKDSMLQKMLLLNWPVILFKWSRQTWILQRRRLCLKGNTGVAYADCFAAALSKRMKAMVITGDPEFLVLENETEVHWITESTK